MLVFAGLLLTMGAVGDRFGRKLALDIGLVVFGLSSVLSAFAGSAGVLIASRAVMGVGGALIMPATLSIITATFPPKERGRAIGVWAGVAGLGIVLGPLVGGWLLERYWWGSVFLVNVPVIAVAPAGGLAPGARVQGPARPSRWTRSVRSCRSPASSAWSTGSSRRPGAGGPTR